MMSSVSWKTPALGRAFAIAATLTAAACGGSAATTRPAAATSAADVVAAHGYAIPREQLARYIAESLTECGWTLKSADEEGGSFVAQKRSFAARAHTLLVVVRPAGDRLRVDVTSTSEQAQVFDQGDNKKNVWVFYEALDKRAGEPSPSQ